LTLGTGSNTAIGWHALDADPFFGYRKIHWNLTGPPAAFAAARNSVINQTRHIMNRRRTFILTTIALLGLAVGLPAADAVAQQKQRISYNVSAENSKYTQQHVIDVGDVPGHQVRVYEIYRSFPSDAPVINGQKVKETWTRATSDYTDGNGTSTTHGVMTMETGDKIFTRGALVAQNAGGGKLTATGVATITGGTGKLAGIQGTTRSVTQADTKAGFNETQSEIEYWIAK
jgi:hypothetical protein